MEIDENGMSMDEDDEKQPYRLGEDGTEWEVITCDTCGDHRGVTTKL